VSDVLFDPAITQALRDLLPWAGEFFKFITAIGGELVYIGIILIGYWTIKKREAILAAVILTAAILSNYWLKYMIANPRPDSSLWLEGVDTTNYSTPSGHAQYSATFYGWFALKIRTGWMYALSLILTLLIGVSRVYLGVHYLGDVLLGWAIGLVMVFLLYRFQEQISALIARTGIETASALFLVVGLVMMAVSTLLPPPPGTNFGDVGGFTMGLAVAIPLERRYVSFTVEAPDGKRWKLALRVVIGMLLIMTLLIGLEPLLPSSDLWLRAVRYFLVTLTGIFVWPLIFKRVGL